MTSSRTETLERERRWAPPAAIAAIGVPVLYIGSTFVQASAGTFGSSLLTEEFRSIAEHEATALLAAITSALAYCLMGAALLYLYRAAKARSERVSGAMLGFPVIAAVLMLVQGLLSGIGQIQLASDFAEQSLAGGDIYTLFKDLSSDATLLTTGRSLALPAFLALIVATVYVPLQAMRAGLLTQFFGTLGMVLGFGLILFPVLGIPLDPGIALAIWFGWLGFLFIDRTPRGRPPAWAAGEARPWPKPGEEPAALAAGAGNGAVDAEAGDVLPAGSGSKERPARRERARKRKRKRRG